MKFGLSIPYFIGTPTDVPAIAKRAEELGFESVWISEHPVIPTVTTTPHPGRDDGSFDETLYHMLDPFVTLAMAAAVTKDIRLGTGICLVTERNPLVLAKEVATLDFLSGGRFILGIGAGIFEEEVQIMGGDFPHRWTQARECIEALKELWTKDDAEYHGKYYDFPQVKMFPKPIQKPHPPVLIGGGGTREVKTPIRHLRRAATWGDGWMPYWIWPEQIKEARATLDRLAEENGRDPKSVEITIFGCPPERDLIKRFEEAGVVRVCSGVHSRGERVASPDMVIPQMESLAKEILY